MEILEGNGQHSLSWFRQRIGKISGSNVGLLMKSSRNGIFSDTAKSYIFQVAAERAMNPEIVNDDIAFTPLSLTLQVVLMASFMMKNWENGHVLR